MSDEVLNIVKGLDLTNIEIQFAMQCAPVIMGLKVSNLLIISNENTDKVKNFLSGTDLVSQIFLVKEEKTVLFIYRLKQLEQYLSQGKVKELMRQFGYQQLELESIFTVFSRRYARYCQCGGTFPHELGILLGYPIEDVTGFIENDGKNFLYTGYWKVYKNIGEKIYLFRQFELAKESLIQLVAMGGSITEVIKE